MHVSSGRGGLGRARGEQGGGGRELQLERAWAGHAHARPAGAVRDRGGPGTRGVPQKPPSEGRAG
eukprot:CAMPEP_0198435134 /NCGR_PEP_ID=MMETSP1452-20131203/36308_1 /TAXON_ID=1181717 /ORGANISM="Synchroma pusillum, Strain CCMP3072" /LENGTH=64 /DNA_ID=CAMNT_0044155659 /DNA_START=10 /DNA_END=201 /DNA_ORIENTATION=-